MKTPPDIASRLRSKVSRARLVDTAVRLVEVPSPTGDGGAVADRLAEILRADGFEVERPEGGYPRAPGVAVRFASGRAGPTLQFDGHLDTVHLPFVPPKVEDGQILGSGACDMKGGVAAAVEALRALRDADALSGGAILLTAHDLHESPWGDGRQLEQMVRDGYLGDAVLIPEPMHESLPVVGRGLAIWKAAIVREGPTVHEVRRPPGQPSVLAAGAELIARLGRLDARLAQSPDPLCGAASVFVGQVHGGEIYNQDPRECWLEGTRRWLPGTDRESVRREFLDLLEQLGSESGTRVDCDWIVVRDPFSLDREAAIVSAFQDAYASLSGAPLPIGSKPFVDDGNTFCAAGRIPAITHGPRSGGQHTTHEWTSIDDLVRVAELYALTASAFCDPRP